MNAVEHVAQIKDLRRVLNRTASDDISYRARDVGA